MHHVLATSAITNTHVRSLTKTKRELLNNCDSSGKCGPGWLGVRRPGNRIRRQAKIALPVLATVSDYLLSILCLSVCCDNTLASSQFTLPFCASSPGSCLVAPLAIIHPPISLEYLARATGLSSGRLQKKSPRTRRVISGQLYV